MWQEAMSDLNEQIHVEDDTLDLAPGEKRPTVSYVALHQLGAPHPFSVDSGVYPSAAPL